MSIILTVDDDFDGLRIDKFITDSIGDISRTRVQKLITDGNVLVNSKTIKSNYKINSNDYIEITIPKPLETNIKPENITLDILYEDDDLIVINKPKNMVVHPAPGHYSGTIVNALMYHCGNNLSGINGILRPGIVHRIDKDTTGVIIACKNDFSHNNIALQLKNHTINRKYLAIVCGAITDDSGLIDAPIGRNPHDRKKMAINYKNGKNAVTHYKVLKRFEKYTLIECILETGRTHQIRVHMASINHPLLGDETYCNIKNNFSNLQGQVLHAYILGFVHPRTGQYMEFEAPIPEYMEKLIHTLR
ncbi:MAG: RluA family pseudouridine synthase [Eubacterium sp.]